MKLDWAMVAAGTLIILASTYYYLQPIGPPETPIIPQTTIRQNTTTTIAVNTHKTTTSRDIVINRPTLRPLFTSTTSKETTTTTLVPPSCENNKQDADETYKDCGPKCGNCVLMNIGYAWSRYSNENLWLRLNKSERVLWSPCDKPGAQDYTDRPIELPYHCYNRIYVLDIVTTEGVPDIRTLSINDTAHADEFEIGLTEGWNKSVTVYIKKAYPALGLMPEYALLTLGGHNCAQNATGFCKRNWNEYKFSLRQREEYGVRIDVTSPEGVRNDNVQLTTGKTTTAEGARIGLLYPYEKGGYCTIYVKKTS